MPNKSQQRRGTGRRSGEDRPPDTASGHRRATARVPALAARGDGAVPRRFGAVRDAPFSGSSRRPWAGAM